MNRKKYYNPLRKLWMFDNGGPAFDTFYETVEEALEAKHDLESLIAERDRILAEKNPYEDYDPGYDLLERVKELRIELDKLK